MNVRAQISMAMNLDKCLGCHTCTVTCKNVWTNRPGAEYMWWNNVETRPGPGYPRQWENQDRYNGGWALDGGKLKLRIEIKKDYKPPGLDDYYELWTYDYEVLFSEKQTDQQPVARPISLIDGRPMDVSYGPNWNDDLAGTDLLLEDPNLDPLQKSIYAQFKDVFMMYLPRICNHCLNPSCLAACPRKAIYKREEDGIVLVDQSRCRGYRYCVAACPYKKVYYNWKTGKSEKCILCYPRIEAGQPTVCSLTCVGKIRYMGVLLYDADKVLDVAAEPDPTRLMRRFIDEVLLDPFDPNVVSAARSAGIPDDWITAAQRSPVYKMVKKWQVAFPLHPEFRTLPMIFYVPPLSPVVTTFERTYGAKITDVFPRISELRIPVKYLASMFTAGDTALVEQALRKLIAVRIYERSKNVAEPGLADRVKQALAEAGLTEQDAEEMYRLFAIARYEDRFVIPTNPKRYANQPQLQRGVVGLP
ncbi:MAG: nitrate reductase subunit beta [Pyrobaculum sp.]|jgi:nitrate reductase beta subunit|nr:nitrate reductase subunit beta [Pyrobaculum sp.]